MHARRLPIAAVIVVGIIASAYAGWRYTAARRLNDATLDASGTIEATQVDVASKIPGRVTHIMAEGTEVAAGQVVARLDTAELNAQVAQARAAVDAARARVAQGEQAVRTQRAQAESSLALAQAQLEAARARVPQARTAETLQAEQVEQQVAQAQAQVAAAQSAVEAAAANRNAVEAALAKARQDLSRLEGLLRDGAVAAQQVDAARTQVQTLEAQLRAAQAQEETARRQVDQARAALRAAEQNRLQASIRRGDITIAQAQVAQAEAGVRTARLGADQVALREEELAAARAALRQAEAARALVRAQFSNAFLRAPVAGLVVTKNVETGEVVSAGLPLLTIANLDDMRIRVFIPEREVGRVKVGQAVDVLVDGFPRRPFRGTVSEIASRAEFTPGTVQTKEERTTLVFAVKIKVPNPDRLLKPGMGADAVIYAVPAR